MIFEYGDVIFVLFPFTDQTTNKNRPAVVVSTTLYNAARPDVVLMALTSRLRPEPAFGEVILQDWAAAGLASPSVVKPIFATFEQALATRRLGRLGRFDREALGTAIRTCWADAR